MIVGAGKHSEDGETYNKDENDKDLAVYELTYPEGKPKYQTGGAETHELKDTQLPPHIHSIEVTLEKKGTGTGTVTIVRNVTYEVKGGQEVESLNNMPPYIALYFCKKD